MNNEDKINLCRASAPLHERRVVAMCMVEIANQVALVTAKCADPVALGNASRARIRAVIIGELKDWTREQLVEATAESLALAFHQAMEPLMLRALESNDAAGAFRAMAEAFEPLLT